MSIGMLERAARELAPFLDELAFVGGATVVLWITDPAAPDPRPTKDVDVVVEVASRLGWNDFQDRLRARGLREDSSSPVICRWVAGRGTDELLVDVMPADAAIFGFENRWQRPGLDNAQTVELPSGQAIRAITPPYLVATKLEAWNGRGRGDHLASHDLEDVILLVDGREEIVAEVAAARDEARSLHSGRAWRAARPVAVPRQARGRDRRAGRSRIRQRLRRREPGRRRSAAAALRTRRPVARRPGRPGGQQSATDHRAPCSGDMRLPPNDVRTA